MFLLLILFFFFFNDTATTEIYTLSLHDALPILRRHPEQDGCITLLVFVADRFGNLTIEGRNAEGRRRFTTNRVRSEEHTSELQSQSNLVCRLLLEKKKKKQ